MKYNDVLNDVKNYRNDSNEEIMKQIQHLEHVAETFPHNAPQEQLDAYYKNEDFFYALARIDPYLYDVLRDFNIIKMLMFLNKTNVLDFGCGQGTLGIRIAQNGLNVTMIDMPGKNFEYLKWRCQQHNLNITLLTTDEFKFDKKYEAIICLDVFEHLYNPVPLLINLINMLENNGIFFITTQFSSALSTNPEPVHVTYPEKIIEFSQVLEKNFKQIHGFNLPNGQPYPIELYPYIYIKKPSEVQS